MKAIRKIVFLIVFGALIVYCSSVSASDIDTLREAGANYSQGEVMMFDGPLYVNDQPYYVVDYMLMSEVKASLVYDLRARQFVKDRVIMSRVFGIRAFKNVTTTDPLFYAVGDPSVIPLAAKYETQNVRNFAEFSLLDADEIEALETFLEDYERTAQKVADSIRLTNALLRPGIDIKVSYEGYPLNIIIEEQSTTDRFSYEGCQQLLNAYEDVYSEYSKLTSDLSAFSGTLEDMPPGTIIREKRGIKITKESILGEIELVGENGDEIRREIDSRSNILSGDYADEIKTAEKRLEREERLNLRIGIIIAALIAVLLLRYLRKRPGASVSILLVPMILLAHTSPAATLEIPTPEELMSKQVTNASQVEIRIFAEGIDNETARGIVEGYPLILEGESVYVGGPYYHEGESYYLFDIVDGGVPTGSLILVDASTLHMVGSYRIIDRLIKTSHMTSMVRERPLYTVDPELLESEAMKANDSSTAVFLARLAENVREGKELEEGLVETPDFDTARDLARSYRQGFLLLEKMKQVASPSEVEELTHGFAKETAMLEGYYMVMQYTLTDGYMQVSQSRYRGRCLNRIPMMQELAGAGLSPSKNQVTHDLTTDLIYGNTFIWRLGKIDPPYFASLPRKLGEISYPGEE